MLVLVYWLACDLRYILRDSAGALSTYRTAMSLILPVLSLAVFLLVHLPVCSLALLRAAVRAYCPLRGAQLLSNAVTQMMFLFASQMAMENFAPTPIALTTILLGVVAVHGRML